VPDQSLQRQQLKLRVALAQNPPLRCGSKRLMKRALREQLEQAVKLENEVFAERVRSDDAKQAFAAFFEKRQPA